MTCSVLRLLGLALLAGGCSATRPSDLDADDRDASVGPDAEASPCGPPSMLAPDASASADACCNDGLFEVHAPDRVYTLRIEGCRADWRCEVDGVEQSCGIGHGTLVLRLSNDISTYVSLQLSILECIGDSAIGYYDRTDTYNVQVPVCRVSDRAAP